MEKETTIMKVIKWSIVGVVVIVGLITLVMSWYSMMDLATTTFGAPTWLAAFVSLAFDGGAIALLLVTVHSALKGETSIAAELFSLMFIAGSFYLNITHAGLAGMGTPGQVMFGAAPIILAIVFKFLVHLLTRDKRREENLLKEKIPSAGFLAWIFKFRESKALFMAGLENNVNKARGHLKYVPQVELPGSNKPAIENKKEDPINVGPASVGEPIEEKKEIVELPIEPKAITEKPAKIKKVTTEWTPEEEPESINDFYRICVEEGVGPTKALPYALTIDPTTNEERVKKGLQRTRKAMSG